MLVSENSVVVLFGGLSSERLVSTASAQHLAAECPNARFWYWSVDGAVAEVKREELMAHQNPFKMSFAPTTSLATYKTIETALDEAARAGFALFLALHGGEGEDGSVQRKLEDRKLAFTGSGSEASAAAFDKDVAKRKLPHSEIKMAEALCVNSGENGSHAAVSEFLQKYKRIVLKPRRDGSSVGLGFVDSQAELDAWWKKAGVDARDYIVEERVFGREFTVGVADIDGNLKALPVSEVVITSANGSFDYDGKYLGRGSKEITPAVVSKHEESVLQSIGLKAHELIGCFGYSRTDIIMGEKGAYYLETNTLPGLTRASFIPQQLAVAGISMKQFVDAQLALAIKRNTAR
jgi:D-alanine-D-alanine ligase